MSELEKDGLIRRFSFTFDLAWKVMQDYLLHEGYNDIKGPRACITQMAANGITDSFLWNDLLQAHNELSHIYDEDKSRSYIAAIVNDFLPVLAQFERQLAQKL